MNEEVSMGTRMSAGNQKYMHILLMLLARVVSLQLVYICIWARRMTDTIIEHRSETIPSLERQKL